VDGPGICNCRGGGRDWGNTTNDRLPSMLLENASWIGEEGVESLGVAILGGVVVMRILLSTVRPLFEVRNIR